MSPQFREAIESLHAKYEQLIAAAPYARGMRLPEQGVYLFRENGIDLYVGRSNRIARRYADHTNPGARTNQAAFAKLLVRKSLNLVADYRRHGRTVANLSGDPEFTEAFLQAKARIRTMEFRAVEERDQTRQALLEIYCAITLRTPYNDFKNH